MTCYKLLSINRKKVAQVPLSARTVASQNEDIAEGIKTHLLYQIVTSPWFAIQCDESTDIENKAVVLVFVLYLYEEDSHEDMLSVCYCQKTPQPLNSLSI